MKYFVIGAKHHDGFAIYHSKVSPYNIVDATPFDRDPLKELAEACAKRDIKYGFYYSHSRDWDEKNAAGNVWDWPADRKIDLQQYMESKALPQMKELLTNYGPLFLIWYDTPDLLSKEQSKIFSDIVEEHQPATLVNSRIGHGMGDYEQMGDNQVPVGVRNEQVNWEIPATLNDTWGFKRSDTNWKDPADLVFRLVDIVSKGGNYLLNVGPDATGTIPEASREILRTMGDWVRTNAEAIYGTGSSPFHPVGVQWRCTTKPGKLFFHVLKWSDALQISGLENPLRRAYFLDGGESVDFTRDGESLTFHLPGQPVDPLGTVIVTEIEGDPLISKGSGWDDIRDIYELHCRITRMVGDVRYDPEEETVTHFRNGMNWPRDEIWWNLKVREDAEYEVFLEYACSREDEEGSLIVDMRVADGDVADDAFAGQLSQQLEVPARATTGMERIRFGEVRMVRDVNFRFIFKTDKSGKSAGVRVHQLILQKIT
jgi:alpha-L-fucosidase